MRIQIGVPHIICYAHTLNLAIQKILHCNKTSEQSGFQYCDDDSESEKMKKIMIIRILTVSLVIHRNSMKIIQMKTLKVKIFLKDSIPLATTRI